MLHGVVVCLGHLKKPSMDENLPMTEVKNVVRAWLHLNRKLSSQIESEGFGTAAQ